MVDQGLSRLRIVIIDTRNLGPVVDARKAALQLGYDDANTDRRRQLRYFWDEYLVHGGVSAYKDAILTAIPADGPEVTVHEGGRPIRLPSSFWNTRYFESIKDEFEGRLYVSGGYDNVLLLDMMMNAMEYQ